MEKSPRSKSLLKGGVAPVPDNASTSKKVKTSRLASPVKASFISMASSRPGPLLGEVSRHAWKPGRSEDQLLPNLTDRIAASSVERILNPAGLGCWAETYASAPLLGVISRHAWKGEDIDVEGQATRRSHRGAKRDGAPNPEAA